MTLAQKIRKPILSKVKNNRVGIVDTNALLNTVHSARVGPWLSKAFDHNSSIRSSLKNNQNVGQNDEESHAIVPLD